MGTAPTRRSSTFLVGSYTEPLPHVHGRGEGISEFFLNADGTMTEGRSTLALRNPSWLSRAGSTIYAALETSDATQRSGGMVAAVRCDEHTGALTLLGTVDSGGAHPAHAVVTADLQFLLVANYTSGSLASITLEPDGTFGRVCDVQMLSGAGSSHARQGSPHPHQVVEDPNTGALYVPDLGTDLVRSFWVRVDGRIQPYGRDIELSAGSGPRHMAFIGDSNHAVVVNELAGTVTTLQRNGGIWTPRWTGPSVPAPFPLRNEPSGVVTSGRAVFVANRGEDTVSVFLVDDDMALHLTKTIPVGAEPRALAIDPTQDYLLVANQNSDTVASFPVHGSGVGAISVIDVRSPAAILFVGAPSGLPAA